MSNAPVSTDLSPEDVAAALKQARARGLPDGWTVKLDKRRRRKWICTTNGRSCDSIPKALKISIEAGLLPADFPLDAPVPKKVSKGLYKKNKPGTYNKKNKKPNGGGAPSKLSKKRPATTKTLPAAPKPKKLPAIIPVDDFNDEDPESHLKLEPKPPSPPPSPEPEPEPEVDPGPDSDPETSFHFTSDEWSTKPATVHWDPNSTEGCKVGWKIRLWCKVKEGWRDGRVIRYDPYTHKHKVQYSGAPRKVDNVDKKNCAWLRLVDEVTQLGTRFVWAHVKGFAWWPAQVMDCDPPAHGGKIIQKEGYVFVNFFGSDQVATLRDTLECVRPFDGGKVDAVILKNKKKRNSKAVQLANKEQTLTREARNEAAHYYARKAFEFQNVRAMNLLGKRVEVFRSDVNYPYGETVVGTVRKYSTVTKKWLLSYRDSRYGPSWINLKAKEYNYKVLDKKMAIQPKDKDLVPFMVGYENAADSKNRNTEGDEEREELTQLLFSCCRGCVEPLKVKKETPILKCHSCQGSFHPDCLDSPITDKTAQRILDEGKKWNCSRCTQCKGCLQHDITFGSHIQSPPATLTLESSEQLHLCSTCNTAYEEKRFCTNCAHTWNDDLYQKIMRRFRWKGKRKPAGKKRGRKRKYVEPETDDGNENDGEDQTPEQIEVDLEEHSIEPSWFYPESEVWGFNEGAMLICDSCKLWVHAGCAKLSRDEYEETSAGDHPIYSKEFLCRTCCKRRCKKLIEALQKEDNMDLFAIPVTEQVAPNYHDVIKNPMDLQSMLQRAVEDEYLNYAWVREAFELMVLNALTFNSHYSKFWNEARRFYHESLRSVFAVHGRAAPPGKYAEAVKENFLSAKRAKQMEEERVQEDETTEKKDLVAGSEVAVITLPPLSDPVDMPSCLPFTEVKLKALDAYYLSWMDCCFTCGSSGAADTMLFCVDCGEAFHSFCVNAPIHSMLKSSVAGWRCPNCKVCEITGEVPKDETKMLFCEMCDRAFSLDLLDPPLKSAPDGLWICGQCVDCRTCGNTLEKKGASLKYWSRDPIKCYRCGGCKGLIDKAKKMPKCVLCSKFWRETDEDLVECSTCHSRVHVTCDKKADEFLKLQISRESEQNSENAENEKSGSGEAKYECPPCRKKHGCDTSLGKVLRKQLHDQAWLVILQGTLAPHANYTFVELHDKLSQEIDWRMRNMWRDDYRVVIKEGLRLLSKAREKLGSTKAIIDKFSHGSLELPQWMGHRAARFIRRSKRSGWDIERFPKKDVETLVSMAISAASFMKVACRAMGINTKKNVKCYHRMVKMLKAPDSCGLTDLPIDTVRTDGNRHIIQEKEWESKFEPQVQQALPSFLTNHDQNNDRSATQGSRDSSGLTPSEVEDAKYIIATPMRGWNSMIPDNDRVNEWKDPRACCLCRTCGDDDAGLPPQNDSSRKRAHQDFFDQAESNSDKPNTASVGRLLPMSGGMWVHASCALWSSEVWEASGGVVHSMDKARSRGSQLKCFGCGRPGATVGCSKANCSSNYHFPCAKACGSVFTSNQSMFCKSHTSHAVDLVQMASFEQMRPLSFDNQIATDGDQIDECIEKDSFLRIGSLTVHSLGAIDEKLDGFHSKDYITPPGYIATRIFWSICKPKTRTVYVLKVENVQGNAIFSATPGDDPGAEIRGRSADKVYKALLKLVHEANRDHFSHGNMFSKLPMLRNFEKRAYGLNAAQFFGFGINTIRRALETLPDVEAVVTPLSKESPSYEFCFVQPSMDLLMDLQRKRAAVAAEKALENPSGCARTEGHHAVLRSGGSGRITRALVKSAGGDAPTDASDKKTVQEETQADRESNQLKYREMKTVPLEDRLAALRSHIHGWGLFTKVDIKKHGMIIEYMGEVVRQCIADKREKGYEESGIGSCYMFRLDLQRIVDATMIGCMARFMNHCCRPNAYAKVITVDTENGADKKIVVFANRDIAAGEEVTYDYKFPVEDGSLKCTCGAPNCIGRMN